MKYIELPMHITTLETSTNGPFFSHGGKQYGLEEISAQANNQCFEDKETGLQLSVTSSCPKLDKNYVEYQPGWYPIFNGLKKAEEVDGILDRQKRYTDTLFLSADKRREREATLKERKDHRYNKDSHSV